MMKTSSKNIIILSAILGLLIVFSIFIIRPGITGYSIYQQIKKTNYSIEDYGQEIKELEAKLLISDTNLSSYKVYNEELLLEIKEYSEKLSEYKTELNFTTETYEEMLKDLRLELSEMNRENVDLKYDYTILTQNLANNLCCKAKVDNSNINSYRIDKNMIKCLEDEELKINC